ncbi:nitrogenous transferase, partial [Baffinella frigidus]
TMAGHAGGAPSASKRIMGTDDPCIVAMQKMMRGKEGLLSLAQGIVFWGPPKEAVAAATAAVGAEASTNAYCADDGLPAFREMLTAKLKAENGLERSSVMVTSGSNQAYTNVVLATLDAGDRAVLFAPFYFNHAMALQMTGVERERLRLEFSLGVGDETAGERPKLVTLVNPGNPSGVMLPEAVLKRAQDMCAAAGVWLLVDNAYEYFAYESSGHPAHVCIEGEGVFNTFSFSKSYGMMGWRIGYLAYPPSLTEQLFKAQDTIPICPPVISQKAAMGALAAGKAWVMTQVASLEDNKKALRLALEESLGPVLGGSGAIYFMARLPEGCPPDPEVVEFLAANHKVCVIPGSACGYPGHIRVCYSNLDKETCQVIP